MLEENSFEKNIAENGDVFDNIKFRWFFENSPIGKSITNIDGKIFGNKEFADILGYSLDELKQKNWRDITHPDDIQESIDVTNSLIEGNKESAIYTKRYIKKDGQIVWVEIRTGMYRNHKNSPICFFTNIIDITEKKQAIRNKEIYHKILEILSDIKDENKLVIKILEYIKIELQVDAIALRYADNDELLSFRDTIGFTEDFIKNECYVEKTKSSKNTTFDCLCGYVLNTQNCNLLSKKGSFITNDLSKFKNKNLIDKDKIIFRSACIKEVFKSIALIPLYDKNKQRIGILQLNHKEKNFFTIDLIDTLEHISKSLSIALQKEKLVKDLNEKTQNYKDIVENIDEVFFIVDCNKNIEFVSPSVQKIASYTPSELQKTDLLKFIHPDEKEIFIHNINLVLKGSSVENEYRLLGKNGEYFWVKTISKPFYKNDDIVGIIGTFRVIEEKKKKETEISRLNKELEQIIYVTSHDLRTPLVNINGFSNEIKRTLNFLSDTINHENDLYSVKETFEKNYKLLSEYLQFIFPSITKIDNLINSLLELSRVGRNEINLQKIDMNKLIQEISMIMEFKLKSNDVILEKTELPFCVGDENLLNQLFSNLIDNAIKYKASDRPAKVKIYSKELKNKVQYYIEDNGIGIKNEDLEKVFELFFRSNKTVQGEGIGLSIVRKIIEKLNGEITVQSKFNEGSTFIVTLPNNFK